MRENERDQETPMKPKERREGKEEVGVEVETLKPLVWREEKEEEEELVEVGTLEIKREEDISPNPKGLTLKPQKSKEKKMNLQTLKV